MLLILLRRLIHMYICAYIHICIHGVCCQIKEIAKLRVPPPSFPSNSSEIHPPSSPSY